MQFNIDVISSNSKGNCIVYDNKIMVDLGLPYSKLKEALKDTKLILLTHIHSDHFNTDTIRKVIVNHENIIFGCGEWLEEKLINIGVPKERLHVYEIGEVYNYKTYKIIAIKLYHDVSNCGYRILRVEDGYKHIHITDTKTVNGIVANNYNSAAIECNYEEEFANNLIEIARRNKEFTHVAGSINSHLSVQQSIEFINKNKVKKMIPLHISSSMKEIVKEYIKENI